MAKDAVLLLDTLKIDKCHVIIHGKTDPLIKVKNAFHTHKLIKNSKIKIIDNMGHLIEEPVFDQFKIDLENHLKINC